MNLFVENQTAEMLSQPIDRVKPVVVYRQPRIANVERLRIVSAFGVASFHTHNWFPRSIGVVGFIILLLGFCAFVVDKPEARGMTKMAKRKAQRLLKPWLFWSLMYGVVGLAKMVQQDMSFFDVFSPIMLLTGTRIHLWFLPFAFVAALLLNLIHRRTLGVSDSFKITVAILIGALCILICSVVQFRLYPPAPLAQWALGLSAVPLGFAIGRIKSLQRTRDRKNYFMFMILSAMAACVACMVIAWFHSGTWWDCGTRFAFRYLVSLVIFCSALHWQGRLDRVSENLASLSYGIYLVHVLVAILLFQFGIATRNPLLLLFLVLSISSLITFILRNTQLKQFV